MSFLFYFILGKSYEQEFSKLLRGTGPWGSCFSNAVIGAHN